MAIKSLNEEDFVTEAANDEVLNSALKELVDDFLDYKEAAGNAINNGVDAVGDGIEYVLDGIFGDGATTNVVDFGHSAEDYAGEKWDQFTDWANKLKEEISTEYEAPINTLKEFGTTVVNGVTSAVSPFYNSMIDSIDKSLADGYWDFGTVDLSAETFGDILGGRSVGEFVQDSLDTIIDGATDVLAGMNDSLGSSAGLLTSAIGNVATTGISSLLQSLSTYNDGSTETMFGGKQEKSWRNFTKAVKSNSGKYKVKVVQNTPLNSENGNLFGNMIMGAPFTFNDISDPLNRTITNTFVKDAKFLSLTPGLPQYNGSRYLATSKKKDILRQTESFNDMMDYLIKNGVDKSNMDKDKRFYTFKTSFGKYYSYLETMLNALWIKLGLGSNTEEGTFNLMTFFENGFSTDDKAEPKAQYCSALGFFVNPVGTVSENISNEKSGHGNDLASRSNGNSDNYQKINYLSGMGTGGINKNLARTGLIAVNAVSTLRSDIAENTTSLVKGWKAGKNILTKALLAGFGAIVDVARVSLDTDLGSIAQSYAVTNGMKVMYPELWADGSYSKSMTFDFNFVSPYGDPLSIFKYVYVPFCCLLCLTLPRQADDNGYVSPFFVRADMPGVITCDLGFISNMSYTKGGGSGLFTKDGLPRAISGSFLRDSGSSEAHNQRDGSPQGRWEARRRALHIQREDSLL